MSVFRMIKAGTMMKKIYFLIVLLLLAAVHSVSAQDYKATADSLEAQLQIMQLQATIDALQNNTVSTPSANSSGNSDGIYIWNQQNSGYSATPTPFNYSNTYPNTTVSSSNFPSQVRPLVPSGPPPVWNIPYNRYSTEITVGDAGQYSTISDALKHLPSNAGAVTIYMVSDTEEPQDGFSIPFDRKVTSVRITSNNNNRRTVWPAGRSIWFFCNGVPLIVDETVTFAEKSMIMGGFVTYSGHNVQAPKSTIIINGKAHWVYAGGQSDREGHSSTVSEALVIINGKVDRVYAGGRAIWGETVVHNATVVVNGTANEIYCGGYTENASAKVTVGQANMRVYGWYNKFGLGLGAGQSYLLTPVGCYQ